MAISKGVEDTPEWARNKAPKSDTSITLCRKCKEQIEVWHCDEKNCPWCKKCGVDGNVGARS